MNWKVASIVIGLLVILSCDSYKTRVVIDQECNLDSYLECTYYVTTNVWVREPFEVVGNLEWRGFAYDVPLDQVEKVKQAQMEKAWEIRRKINKVIESGINPCEKEPK
jgi:hypothetical protein